MRRAFTLVELLVVVSIIALLLGILLPALSRVRGAAQGAACASNLRQLLMACRMYAVEQNDYLPFPNSEGREKPGGLWAGRPGWLYQYPNNSLPEHVKGGVLWDQLNQMKVYRCVSDKGPWTAGPVQNLSSYVMSTAVRGFGNVLPSVKISAFYGSAIILWEANEEGDGGSWNDGNNDPPQAPGHRHNGAGSIGIVDGHVETIRPSDWQDELAQAPGRLWCNPFTVDGKPVGSSD